MDVDVGRNIGAHLQIDQAEADKQIAQARAEQRRAEAAAREEEMRANTGEQRARLVEAEARVPLGLAAALRSGRLGTKVLRMGFFDEIQAKLKALEEAALEAQAEQQRQTAAAQKKLFQPKVDFEHVSATGTTMPGSHDPHHGSVTDPIGGRGAPRSSQESAFSSPVETKASRGRGETSIFDNLGERLDEAYLLQEILGEPRCVRGWGD